MKLVSKAAILIIMASVICLLAAGCTKKDSINVQTKDIVQEGKLLITVVDKATKKPVGDAKIVIAGTDNYFKTDDKGQSPEITLNVNKDIYKRYGAELYKKAPSGAATIFITKDGYKDYIVFNRPVYPGTSANNVSIQMSKLSTKDTEKYVVDTQYPHNLWLQQLVEYCKGIKDEKDGSGENKIVVNVKDSNSKVVQGAFIAIPELGIKVSSDKNGAGTLKPAAISDLVDIYPVKQQLNGYTVVVGKDGYVPVVVFNVAASKDKDGKVDVVLKPEKAQQNGDCVVTSQPYDKEWINAIISSYKEQKE